MGIFTSEKTDKAKYKKLKEADCVVSFSVEVPQNLVEQETQNLLVRIQQRAKIPGFRPGKAPLELVKKNFTGHAQEQVLDSLIRKYTPEAMKELNIRPVAVPAVEDVSFEPGKPVKFTVRAETAPTVTPKDYTKIAVKRVNYAADDKALDARMNELREANARLEKAAEEQAGKTHYVVIDYQAYQDDKPMAKAKGENELVDMSSDQTVEGLVEGLQGMKIGETKDVKVKLGDKPSVLKVTVKEIKTKVLPAVDAEFAKDMGFESLDQLKAKLKEVIEDEGKAKTEREVQQQIEEALMKANKFAVPPALAQNQLEHMINRLRQQMGAQLGEEQLKELQAKLLPRAEDEVRMGYLLPAIADKEKLTVTEEELKAELDKNLASIESEDKKNEVRKMFEERKEAITSMIRDRKTMQFIRDAAKISDK
jgi:trigger factor